jgi:hypothetical protein
VKNSKKGKHEADEEEEIIPEYFHKEFPNLARFLRENLLRNKIIES